MFQSRQKVISIAEKSYVLIAITTFVYYLSTILKHNEIRIRSLTIYHKQSGVYREPFQIV